MTRRVGIQLAYPYESKRLQKYNLPYLVQPKLDGDRCRAIISGLPPLLLSSEGHQIFSVPHIERELSMIEEEVELDGELYTHTLSHDDIRSRVSRSVEMHEDFESIQYHVFDIVDESSPQLKRSFKLAELFDKYKSKWKYIQFVPVHLAQTEEEIFKHLDFYYSQDYEGIIVRAPNASYVRKRSVWMMKFKPRQMDHYRITGTTEELSQYGIPKDTLGALICEKDGQTFRVGSGSFLTQESRKLLWNSREQLVGQYAEVQYQHITPGRGVPRHGVLMNIIVRSGD